MNGSIDFIYPINECAPFYSANDLQQLRGPFRLELPITRTEFDGETIPIAVPTRVEMIAPDACTGSEAIGRSLFDRDVPYLIRVGAFTPPLDAVDKS